MPTIEETINTLKDMGFSEQQAKKALNKTGWSGIEAAAEWLLSHPDDDGTENDADEAIPAEVSEIFISLNCIVSVMRDFIKQKISIIVII